MTKKTTLVKYLIFEEKELLILRGACSLAIATATMQQTKQGFTDMFNTINAKLNEIAAARKPRKSLARDKSAVTALEYGLIAALIAVVIIGSVSALGTDIKATFSKVQSSVASANAK